MPKNNILDSQGQKGLLNLLNKIFVTNLAKYSPLKNTSSFVHPIKCCGWAKLLKQPMYRNWRKCMNQKILLIKLTQFISYMIISLTWFKYVTPWFIFTLIFKFFNMYKLFYYKDMAQKLPDSPPPQKKIIFL